MKKELISNRLNFVKRMRILEKRDLKKGLRLNRNERVNENGIIVSFLVASILVLSIVVVEIVL